MLQNFNKSMQIKEKINYGTPKLVSRPKIGPGSSFRNLNIDSNARGALEKLQKIGFVRGTSPNVYKGEELEKKLQEHVMKQTERRNSVADI